MTKPKVSLYKTKETLTHFNRGVASISGHPWSDSENIYRACDLDICCMEFMERTGIWELYFLWFMIVGMILGEPAHILVFPVVRMVKEGVDYEYFSGMYTALFPMIPAILALTVIIRAHKNRNTTHA